MEKKLVVSIEENLDVSELFGIDDKNIKIIEENLDIAIFHRYNELVISGKEATKGKKVLEILKKQQHLNRAIDEQKVNYIVNLVREDENLNEFEDLKKIITYSHMGKPILAKTIGQNKYVQAISKKDIVFGIGPAGTGKTYLAVAMAANMYKQKEVEKIILARPAVEAGENLGFLPGDLQDKVDPYLRPLYDALYDIFGKDMTSKLREKEVIEVVPLAYMRGRTLDRACIILDEAQNTTKEQMKMFLTRMGFYSKMIITGDVTQIDLPKGKKSGLVEAMKILKNIKDIEFCSFKDIDVVRHQLVKKIIGAYDRYYAKENRD